MLTVVDNVESKYVTLHHLSGNIIQYLTLYYLVIIVNMMTSSNGDIFRVTGPLREEIKLMTGEFPAKKPVTRSFDFFYISALKKRLCEAGDLRRHRANHDVIVMK